MKINNSRSFNDPGTYIHRFRYNERVMSTTFVDRAFACRLESGTTWRSVNYARGYQLLHPDAQCAAQEIAGGYAVYVAPGSPLNSARGMGMEAPVARSDLQAVEDFFFQRGQPAQIYVCPFADESLFGLLREAGYRLDFFFSVLFALIPEGYRPGPLPEGVTIAQAGPEQAADGLRVTAAGFEETDTPSLGAFDILGPNFYAPESAAFLAGAGGQPAGGGGLYAHGGVVELGGASTRPAFRRKGIQRALIEARLAAARRGGCDLAMVLTEPGSDSQRNLQRAGFELAYTLVVMRKEP